MKGQKRLKGVHRVMEFPAPWFTGFILGVIAPLVLNLVLKKPRVLGLRHLESKP
jgi:hypothetical protein